MRTLSRRSHCRGYLLIEMIVIVAIMSIAIFVEVKLYRASISVIRSEPEAQKHLLASNRLNYLMHDDIWGAQTMNVNAFDALTLQSSASRIITWTFDDGQISRSDSAVPGDAGTQRILTAAKVSARVDGNEVIIRVSQDGKPVSEQRYWSQLLLAEARR